jgi:hypothetical protein
VSTAAPAAGNPCNREVEDVAAALGTDLERGLTAAEAARRLAGDGANQLRAAPPVPSARSEDSSAFQHLFVNPLLWGSIALSLSRSRWRW